MHARQCDEPPAVIRPALQNRKLAQVKTFFENDLFARRIFRAHRLGKGACERAQLRQHLQLVQEAFRSLQVQQAADALGDLVQPFDAQSHCHAPLAAELIDEDLVAGVAFHLFKKQRRAAAFGDAVSDLGDLKLR